MENGNVRELTSQTGGELMSCSPSVSAALICTVEKILDFRCVIVSLKILSNICFILYRTKYKTQKGEKLQTPEISDKYLSSALLN